jgi:AraC-like DNA-binding protein
MSPKRYMLLRRMHLARRAQRRANPEKTTVTEIATNCGFWEPSALLGHIPLALWESPLATMRRPPDDASHSESSAPWEFIKSA